MQPLARAGVESIILSTGHLGHTIREHFGSAFQGTPVLYAHEDTPLGTGGGVLWAMSHAGLQAGEACLVLNGDTFLEIDLPALLAWHRSLGDEPLAMVLRNVPDVGRFGAVRVEHGRATALIEKGNSGPGFINAGVYLLREVAFGQHRPGQAFSFEHDVLAPACSTQPPPCWVSDGFFIDIGLPEELDRAQNCFPRPA
jgi:D-glycero-alpha-D-manno-heptose 1-phosphate guanylyltransferase